MECKVIKKTIVWDTLFLKNKYLKAYIEIKKIVVSCKLSIWI